MRFRWDDPQSEQSVRDVGDTTTGVLLGLTEQRPVARHVRPRRGRHARRVGGARVAVVMVAVPGLVAAAIVAALPVDEHAPTPGTRPGPAAPAMQDPPMWIRESPLSSPESNATPTRVGSGATVPAGATVATVAPSPDPSRSEAGRTRRSVPWSLPGPSSRSTSRTPAASVSVTVSVSGVGDLP